MKWMAGAVGTVVHAQNPATIGVDTDPTGNSATSLGSIDWCRVIDGVGETFDIDVFITDITDIIIFLSYFPGTCAS